MSRPTLFEWVCGGGGGWVAGSNGNKANSFGGLREKGAMGSLLHRNTTEETKIFQRQHENVIAMGVSNLGNFCDFSLS